MIHTSMNRREFLNFGLAGTLFMSGGFNAQASMTDRQIVLKPFAHSPTITTFAQGLFQHQIFSEDVDCGPLFQMIDAELTSANLPYNYYWDYRPAEGPVIEDNEINRLERRRAAFFARLAVKVIAPRALRRAGFVQLADDVASGVMEPAAAQHTIGHISRIRFDAAGEMIPKPELESCAYGASAHASTTASLAKHAEIECVYQTGYFCARALLSASFYDDEDIENLEELWPMAAEVMNMAIELDKSDVIA